MKIPVVLFVVLFAVVGCAGSKKHYLPASGVSRVPAAAAAPRYEDPSVTIARALARQTAIDRARWQRACLELRSSDPYATYADCRRVFGDDRNIGYDDGYGRYGDIFRIPR